MRAKCRKVQIVLIENIEDVDQEVQEKIPSRNRNLVTKKILEKSKYLKKYFVFI